MKTLIYPNIALKFDLTNLTKEKPKILVLDDYFRTFPGDLQKLSQKRHSLLFLLENPRSLMLKLKICCNVLSRLHN